MSRVIQSFVPAEGIAREVIFADIQRYLGPDALVRSKPESAESDSGPGYVITAYRTLTPAMIQHLKEDTERWEREHERNPNDDNTYSQSQTHAARQHHGPSSASTDEPDSQDSSDASANNANRLTEGENNNVNNGEQIGSRDSRNPYQQIRPEFYAARSARYDMPETRSAEYGTTSYRAVPNDFDEGLQFEGR